MNTLCYKIQIINHVANNLSGADITTSVVTKYSPPPGHAMHCFSVRVNVYRPQGIYLVPGMTPHIVTESPDKEPSPAKRRPCDGEAHINDPINGFLFHLEWEWNSWESDGLVDIPRFARNADMALAVPMLGGLSPVGELRVELGRGGLLHWCDSSSMREGVVSGFERSRIGVPGVLMDDAGVANEGPGLHQDP